MQFSEIKININKIKKSELLDQLFNLRRIINDTEMERLRPKAGRPKKGTESTKRKYAKNNYKNKYLKISI